MRTVFTFEDIERIVRKVCGNCSCSDLYRTIYKVPDPMCNWHKVGLPIIQKAREERDGKR